MDNFYHILNIKHDINYVKKSFLKQINMLKSLAKDIYQQKDNYFGRKGNIFNNNYNNELLSN